MCQHFYILCLIKSKIDSVENPRACLSKCQGKEKKIFKKKTSKNVEIMITFSFKRHSKCYQRTVGFCQSSS